MLDLGVDKTNLGTAAMSRIILGKIEIRHQLLNTKSTLLCYVVEGSQVITLEWKPNPHIN